MEGLFRDFRFTLRGLTKDRRFTLLAILALALGIGSTTVIFSTFYGVILNTFAFKDADQVTTFFIVDQSNPNSGRTELTLPEFLYYRGHNHVFQDLSGEFGGFGRTPLRYTSGGMTYQFDGCYLSANSFKFFGMQPLLGRLPSEDDVKPGATPVFVIGAKLWRQQFNNDPEIVGRSFTLNGVPRLLVGIMPPRFRWAWVDVWLPFSLDRNEIATNPELNGQMAYTVGRLKPGVSLKEAAADLDVIAHQYAKIDPHLYPKQFTVTARMLSEQAVEGLGFSRLIYPLLGAVGLLLLIACANVANLLLTRATARGREIAVRSALGASRGSLLRQFLVESLCLALAGCALGCLLAYVGIKALVPLIPYNAFPQEAVIELNVPVLLFSLGMAVASTLLCGMAPALHAMRQDLRTQLSGSGTGTAAGPAHGRLRSALVVAEVALSVILLTGAGLMMRTFFRLQNMDLGINTRNVLLARLSFPEGIRQTAEDRMLVFQRFFERLKALPGIVSASPTLSHPPFGTISTDVVIPGKVHSQRWITMMDLCSEGYPASVQLRLRQGRFLSEGDVSSARRVAVVNEALVQQYFGNENPIGQTIKFDVLDQVPDLKDALFEIIGVVSSVKNRGFEMPPMPQAYLPYTITPFPEIMFIARTAVKPESLIPSIRQVVWSVDPNVALIDSTSLEGWLGKYMYANSEFEFITLGSFAGIGLLLVLIGIFSVVAYMVALQTHEIGIRMALGAERRKIIGMVLRKGMILIAGGSILGVAGSLAAARYLSHLVRNVSPLDPWTYGGVVLLVAAAGLASCFMPARRAAEIDPLESMRCE